MAFEHENTPFGSYGEFPPAPDDFDWEAQNAEADAYFEALAEADYAEWQAEAAMAYYDDDNNPYHGDYSEM